MDHRRGMLRRIGGWLRRLVFVVALLAAAVLLGLRALEWTDMELEAPIEGAASQALGVPVEIESASVTWSWWRPVLELRGASVADDALSARRITLGPDIWGSLRHGELRLGRLHVYGAEVVLTEGDAGWTVRGLEGWIAELRQLATGEGTWEHRLPYDFGVSIARVVLVPLEAEPLEIEDAALRFARDAEEAAAAVRGPLPRTLGEGPDVLGVARWPIGDMAGARLFLEAEGVHAPSVAQLFPMTLDVPEGRVGGRLWAHLEEWWPSRVAADVHADEVRFGEDRHLADRVEAVAHWRGTSADWRLRFRELALHRAGETEPLSFQGAELRRTPAADGGHRIEASLADLPLALVHDGLLAWPDVDPGPLASVAGTVSFHRFGADLVDGVPEAFHGEILVNDLDARLEGDLGGVEGVSARMRLDGSRVAARLSSEEGRLALPRVFPAPLEVDAFDVSLGARRAGVAGGVLEPGGRWELGGVVRRARSGDAEVSGRFALHGPAWSAPDHLYVFADAQPIPIPGIPAYLPAGIMPPEVTEWLADSLRGGTARNTRLLWHGDPSAFPFREGDGRFDVHSEISDGVLAFDDEWPAVEGIHGHLRFVGRSMDIQASSARIAGVPVRDVRARIRELGGDGEAGDLTIDGHAEGEGADLLAFLGRSPLARDWLGDPVPLFLEGDARLNLGLRLPLGDLQPETVGVDGSVELQGARGGLEGWVTVENLNGTVNFDERGVAAEAVTGTLAGKPLSLGAWTRSSPAGGTRIDLRTRWHGPLQDLLSGMELPEGYPGGLVQGSSDWRIDARLPGFQGDSDPLEARLTVRSTLYGTALRLPEPFGKAADEERPVRLEVGFTERGLESHWLRYGEDLLQAAFSHRGNPTPVSGGVLLGDGRALRLPAEGFEVRGSLERLQLAGWGAVAALIPEDVGREGDPAAFLRESVDVSVETGQLSFGQRRFGALAVSARTPLQEGVPGVRAQLEGDALAGEIAWFPDAGPGRVLAEFERLDVSLPDPEEPLAPTEEAQEVLADLAEVMPEWVVRVHSLYLDGRFAGEARAELKRADPGMELTEFRVDGERFEASGSGLWREGLTRFHATLESDDVGELLELLGQPRAVEARRTRLRADLEWPGPPWGPRLPAMEGEIELSMEEGRISEARPGAGRLVGLLSLNMLPRRILLDFRDLFEEGLVFDEIDAAFHLADEEARVETFSVASPAANVTLTGRMDLVEQVYDNEVRVEPQLGAMLPLVGGLLGGGIGGAAVGLLIDQFFGGRIDRAGGVEYRVTGPWDEPVVERKRRDAPPERL